MDKSTLSVLIGIMMITMPVALGSVPEPSSSSLSSSHNFYNFSSLSTGSVPVGNSWIDFKTVNSTAGFGYSIKSTAYGNALHVSSDSETVRSYLDMQVNYSLPVSVSFYIMWNNSASNIYRYNHIYFKAGNSEPLEYSFGVKNDILQSGFNTSSGSEISSFVPVSNDIYRVNVSIVPPLGSMSFQIENENSRNISFPLFFNGIGQEDSGNLSILFGGLISAIYIYNITVEKNISKGFLGNYAGNFSYISNSSSIGAAETPYSGNETHPLLDIPLNTVIYVLENGSVGGYNYFDQKTSLVSQYLNSSFLKIETLQNSAYYIILWFHSNSLQMQFVNRTTLALQNVTVKGDFSGFSSLVSGENIVLYNSSGYLYDINISDSGNLNYNDVLPNGYFVMGISQHDGSLNLTASDGNKMAHYTVQLPYFSYTETSEQNIGNYWRDFALQRSVHGNSGAVSILIPHSIRSSGDLLLPGDYSFGISQNTSITSSGSNSVLASVGNSLSVMVGNETYSTGIDMYSGVETVYFASNGSDGIILTNSTVTVYHVNKDYFSPYLDKISSISVYEKEGFLFNVTSFLPYTLNASIENESFTLNDANFLPFDMKSISSGSKVLKAIMTNTAGYRFYYNYSFVIDNGIPDVNITPSQDSYVTQNPTFSISITDNVTIDYVNLTLFNVTTIFHGTNFNFSPDLYGFTGRLNITLLIVDDLGHSFTRYFHFMVMNETISGFSWNLDSSNYFATENLHLLWAPVANVSQYSLFVTGDTNQTYNTTGTGMNLTLMNGNYSILMEGEFLDGITRTLGESNVTVITYRPGILISTGNEAFYSFHGNSVNSTFHLNVSSNITSRITVNGYLPNNNSFLFIQGSSIVNVSIGKGFPYYSNGIYRFTIRSESLSGTSNSTTFSINVNNTIPSFPPFAENVYTNKSSILLPFRIMAGVRYNATISLNSTIDQTENLTGKILNLSHSQGVYLINFSAYSQSGNHDNSGLTVNYYYSPPSVNLQFSNTELTYENYTTLHYTIQDRVPLERLTIYTDNETLDLPVSDDSGNITVWFPHNGNYSIRIVAVDMCGNINSSIPQNVNVDYYDCITGANIGISIVGNTAYLNGLESGNHSDNLRFAWYLNGKYVGNSSTMNLNLPYGYSNLTFKVYYNGKTIEISRKVFVVGWLPEISVLSAIAVILAWRTFRTRSKLKIAIELVLQNKGQSVGDIVKAGKSKGIPGSSVRKAAVRLANSGKISFDRDLDNNLFVKKQ